MRIFRASLIAGLAVAWLASPPPIEAQLPAPAQQEPSGLQAAVALEQMLVDAIAKNESSVVAIALFRTDRPFHEGSDPRSGRPGLDDIPDSYGTGVVLDRRGLILTNAHVLLEKSRIYVRVAGKPMWCAVRIKAADPLIDLAVIEIVDPDPLTLGLQPIALGDAKNLKRGQIVITLGNPYAIARDGQASAGWGIIANLSRRAPPVKGAAFPENRPTMHHYGTLIQTDAKLNIGTSGGPLLNLKGEMIGLTTAMAALSGYEKSAGFAIAVDDTFRRAVKDLVEGREVEYGFLGVRPQDLQPEELAGGMRGVRIDYVMPGAPASSVLRFGDIITHVDGKPLTSATDLMLAVGRRAAGDRVRLTVLRDKRRTEPNVLPGKDRLELMTILTKNRVSGRKVVTNPRPAWRGLRVEYPAALRSFAWGESIPTGCVIVTEVAPNSPAAGQGLREGMQISRVEGHDVATPDEFLAAATAQPGPVRLQLTGPDAAPAVRVIPPAK